LALYFHFISSYSTRACNSSLMGASVSGRAVLSCIWSKCSSCSFFDICSYLKCVGGKIPSNAFLIFFSDIYIYNCPYMRSHRPLYQILFFFQCYISSSSIFSYAENRENHSREGDSNSPDLVDEDPGRIFIFGPLSFLVFSPQANIFEARSMLRQFLDDMLLS